MAVSGSSLRSHHRNEFFVIDLAVTVDISLADHLVHFLVGQLLAQIGHHVAKFSGADETIAVLVEHPERLADLLLLVRILPFPRHHGEELRKVYGAVAVRVHLVNHILKFRFSGILTKGSHHGAQLFGRDGTVAILIE